MAPWVGAAPESVTANETALAAPSIPLLAVEAPPRTAEVASSPTLDAPETPALPTLDTPETPALPTLDAPETPALPYEDRVPDVLCQLYGWGPLGGGHGGSCDGRSTGWLTAPTRHARCVAPGGRADGVANERLSSLAGDAVWQISLHRPDMGLRRARPAGGRFGCRWRGSSGPLPNLRCTSN